ncbi:MAG: hypothetical protein WAQ33_03575, partial [Gaiellaceae bacterium]
GSDSTASVAWFWQTLHEGGYHVLGSTHHTLTGAPFGWNETNALEIQVMLPYYPTYLMAQVVGEVAAFNLITLAGYILSGATMYVLARYLGCARLVAIWAALVYIVFPWHLARSEHASLTHLELLALLVLALVAASRRPSWLRFAFVGAATLGCWLTSGYFGAMAVVTTIAFTVGAALTSERRRGVLLVLGSTACAIVATGLVGIAATASGTNAGAGLNRVSGDLSALGLHPVELVVPAAHNLVVGDGLDSFWARHSHGSNPTEISNYAGLLTLALAVAWVLIAFRRRVMLPERERLATAGLVAAFVVGLAFALPSPALGIPMPSRLLWSVVPAFRVPSRWDPLLMTALVPLAALGLQAVWRRLARPGRLPTLAIGVVGAAMVVSFLELAIHPAEKRFRTVPTPPEYTALDQTPRGILAEYPLGYSDIYRLWQRRHGRPLLNGAPAGTPADSARLMLLDPAQPGTAPALSLLGVTAIEIHPHAIVDAEVSPNEPTSADGYRLVGRFPDDTSVWDVVAPAAPAFVTLPGGFGAPQRAEDGFVGYPFIAQGGVGVADFAASTPGVVRLVLDAEVSGGGQSVLRLADARSEQAFIVKGRVRISVLVEVPRGHSRLFIKTDPTSDVIDVSAPRAEQASGAPALHAQLLSPDPGF